MKSAYELAMERLEKQSPSVKLTDSQRSQLGEIDSLYKSKMAEKELLLAEEIRRERAAGKFSEVEKLQQQLASELRRLSEECEAQKEKVRTLSAPDLSR
jgi:Holliday junction resolvase-like predicted endonuclease